MTVTDKSITSTAAIERFALFGAAPLLPGESAESYDELLGRVCAAAKPANVIEEMFVVDVVALQWQILRWRRLKASLLRTPDHDALLKFLGRGLKDHQYTDEFVEVLTEFIAKRHPGTKPGDYLYAARQYVKNDKDVVQHVNELVKSFESSVDSIWLLAKLRKVQGLLKTGQQLDANSINQIFASIGLSFDDFAADALSSTAKDGRIEPLAVVERLDQLAANAERRRNAALRELDRHRAASAQATRQALQAEDAEFTELPEQAAPALALS